ncbi:response regulator [Paenibacillus aurantiacus]|uniref:Response regulator n=1 Tax=Paenibacillus aurantiacus TaxID=1936118 RepID=A0ABV5L2U0_9BACL
MRILVAEDDLASRRFLSQLMSSYGDCDQTVDGMEALDAIQLAIEEGQPYGLICLDVMMPKLDGVKVLKAVRQMEKQHGIKGSSRSKVILTTALNPEFITHPLDPDVEMYAPKPLDAGKLDEMLRKMGLL